ncbi:hypothetical protein OD91_1789 [Lutibacter sp. Hel_I_33_5]|uniref:hypothetical protein n=1 Tax=Lutibacter sp. Hel_I_33_5 TaxID=1566289 RepID=UPI0011A48982|nr:hypothetical protein [Lutibacter sp. Hel_I_33_5]TVZ56503.1 hypothetical protein OD91_1789 [Lutibacter sp. Hel_I_33_5]
MKVVVRLFLFLCLFFALSSFSIKQDCTVLKNNSFTYKLGKDKVLVVFNEDKHTEYHEEGKYIIQSDIKWISECEYYLIINEATLPNFPFKLGSKLHVKITGKRGKKIYYKSTLGGNTWEGRMTLK